MTKLDMEEEEAFTFARFLVEPRDNEIIKPDPKQKATGAKISIRIMKQLGDLLIMS